MSRHPLQRLASPSPAFSAAIHVAGLVSFAYNFRFLVVWKTPIDEHFGWHFQFLTIVGLSTAALAFTFGLLADVFLSPRLFAAKNALTLVAAPLEILISILYWGISAYDRNLLYPSDLSLPLVADLGFHLNPAIFLALDMLLLSPPWALRAVSAVGLSLGLAVSYWFWVELCYSKNGLYPYPIMGLLDTSQRVLVFLAAAFVNAVSAMALGWIYGFINGSEVAEKEGKKVE